MCLLRFSQQTGHRDAIAQSFETCSGSWIRKWWLMTVPMNRYLWQPERGGIEKTRWNLWLAEDGIITAWTTMPWERDHLFCTGSWGTTSPIKTAAEVVSGVKIRCEHVDLHQSRAVWWAWARPASGPETVAQDHHGKCELGNWGLSEGARVGHGAQRSFEGKRYFGSTELWYRRTLPTPVATSVVLRTVKAQS